MGDVKTKKFEEPDETISVPHALGQVVVVGETYISRTVHQPGFRWSKDVKPLVGTDWCQFHHQGVVISGKGLVITKDGAQKTIVEGEAYDIPPGHDFWVQGNEPLVVIDFQGVRGWGKPPASGERILATLMFTDIVGSTALASKLGDTAWKELLARHNARVRHELDRFRGYEVKTTGDGFLAMFDGTARAVRCAAAICSVSRQDGIEVRAGVHVGEVEQHIDTVHGLAVHIAARIAALAGPGEVLVSSLAVSLLEGAGLSFSDAGAHDLKGVEGQRKLYRLIETDRQ